jgi:hypothetical protein
MGSKFGHLTLYMMIQSRLLVHSDFCSPMPQRSIGGASYLITFIDDATRKVRAYLVRSKDKAF